MSDNPIEVDNMDVQALVDQAMAQANASVQETQQVADSLDPSTQAAAVQMPNLDGSTPDDSTQSSGIELLNDVDLHVKIELGRTQMLVEDVLRLGEGSVVELDKLAGDPVDVYVNDHLVARGEVLVLNDNFCIRVNEIVADLQEQAQAIEPEAG